MTSDARARLEYILKDIKRIQGVSTEAKLLAVREAIRSMLPLDSYIAKAAAEQLPPSSTSSEIPPSGPTGASETNSQQLQDLIDATLAFLPVATEPTLAAAVQRLGSNEPS